MRNKLSRNKKKIGISVVIVAILTAVVTLCNGEVKQQQKKKLQI